jgi:hypothetical protein
VQLAAARAWDELVEDLAAAGDRSWSATRLADAFVPYFDEHDAIEVAGDARGPGLFQLGDPGDHRWRLEQGLLDPLRHREWFLAVSLDQPASAEGGAIRATLHGVERR